MQRLEPISTKWLGDAFLEAKKATCRANTIKTYKWGVGWLTYFYEDFPVTVQEIIDFVVSRRTAKGRSLKPASKQKLYDIIRDWYAWSKGYSSRADGRLPDLPSTYFPRPRRRRRGRAGRRYSHD